MQPTRALQDLERMVLRQDESLNRPPSDSPAGAWGGRGPGTDLLVCPFKGLSSFDIGDADYFCGRDRVVSELVARSAESALVGILGPSGIGKSSLLRAGTAARAEGRRAARQRGLAPGAPAPRPSSVRGARPRRGRRRPGRGAGPAGARAGDGHRRRPARGGVHAGRRARPSERASWTGSPPRPASPSGACWCCARSAPTSMARLGAHPRFAELLSHSHALVGPMDREELTQAIEGPAARAGLSIEHTLVDALVADVADEPGGLPLLSTTLLELWRARDGHTLRFDAYRRSGGVRGAVGRLAEAAYGRAHRARAPRGPQRDVAAGGRGGRCACAPARAAGRVAARRRRRPGPHDAHRCEADHGGRRQRRALARGAGPRVAALPVLAGRGPDGPAHPRPPHRRGAGLGQRRTGPRRAVSRRAPGQCAWSGRRATASG